MYRYLVFAWNVGDSDASMAARRFAASLRGSPGDWATAFESPGLAIHSAGDRPGATQTVVLEHGRGALLGTVFGREIAASEMARPKAALPANVSADQLVDRYWGRYVAVLRDGTDPATTRVLRDPSGTLPCWLTRQHGVEIFFSDLEDVLALGLGPFTLDWTQIALVVQQTAVQARATPFHEICEPQPGECIEIVNGGITARRLLWNPCTIAAADPIEDARHAAEQMRRVVRSCVQAWAACHTAILHRLSGGLDSSIVASCLADAPAGPRVTCLNYFGTGPVEDEREFARHAARKSGLGLMEQQHGAQSVRLEDMFGIARSPRPWFYLYPVERAASETRLARELGATAIFGGECGDSLFYSSAMDLAVQDFVHRRGLRPALMQVAIDVARIHRQSVWSVLGDAVKQHWRTPSEAAPRAAWNSGTAPTGLTNTATVVPGRISPWHESAENLPPGKRHHVHTLWPVPPFYEALAGPDQVENVYPLMSQPIIELCLRVPVDVLINGGRDRAIARRAFAADVPAEVVRRRSKGGITQHLKDIFDAQLPFLREVLLDGELVRHGMLDRARTDAILRPGAATISQVFGEVLVKYLSLEVWIQRALTCAPGGSSRRVEAARQQSQIG